jgi:hypothetical protein
MKIDEFLGITNSIDAVNAAETKQSAFSAILFVNFWTWNTEGD